MYHSVEEFWIATFMRTLVVGFRAWAFGQPKTLHIGASILVFGYMGVLLLRGFLSRSNVARYIAAGVSYLYGANLIHGVLPTQAGVSWEGHLLVASAVYWRPILCLKPNPVGNRSPW